MRSSGFERVTATLCIAALPVLGATACAERPSSGPYDYPAPATAPYTPRPLLTTYPTEPIPNGLLSCTPETFGDPRVIPIPTGNEILQNDGQIFTLEHNEATGSPVGEPGLPPDEVLQHIKGGIVEVKGEGSGGASGFLLAPNVVVTAKHVVDKPNAVITDAHGNTARIIDGCYLHEADGQVGIPSHRAGADIDLAIVVLDKNLGSTTLQLAEVPPEPGEWLIQANTQGPATIENPAIYSALYTEGPWGPRVISGLAPNGSENHETYVQIGGASGGAILQWKNGQLRVIGIGFASNFDPFSYNDSDGWLKNDLLRQCGVVIADDIYTDDIGWYPNPAHIVPAGIIGQVLATEKGRQLLQLAGY